MKHVVIFAVAAAMPALADSQFQIRRMTRNDVPLGKGQCDIRLQVDNEVEVSVRLDTVRIRTIAGRDAYDDGSECNAPLPDREVGPIGFEVRESRNEIRLIAEPSRRNNFTAIVLIRDTAGGQGRYHFRLTWSMTGTDYRRDDTRGGFDDRRQAPRRFMWSGVVNFQGRGRGVADLNGYEEMLAGVTVSIDRGGNLVATFQSERGRRHGFSGVVTAQEGGRLRADVTSEDRRYRGPMMLSVDDLQNINSITLDATDGRDRLQVSWDRR